MASERALAYPRSSSRTLGHGRDSRRTRLATPYHTAATNICRQMAAPSAMA
jgi:hypothetical protein